MTRICRFNENRLGLVEGDVVIDVTAALDLLPSIRWPAPLGDLMVEHLTSVLAAAELLRATAPRHAADSVRYLSPVANPSKIIAAPVNYRKHYAEALADGGRNFDKDVKTIDEYGLFLKANSALVGVSEGIEIAYPARRTDHEIELVAVIGKGGRGIFRDQALNHIAGYCLGLDMTLRGTEDRSLRKSLDSFSVVGPWLVTSDEVSNPNALEMTLAVNGNMRQHATTADLIFDVQRLVEYASAHMTLYPGDLIFTGTPEGVGPVVIGDTMECWIENIARTTVRVRATEHRH